MLLRNARHIKLTYKQLNVNNYNLLVATLARYFHSFRWLTEFYGSKIRYKNIESKKTTLN